MFKIVDDEKNRVSEEELLGAIEENEEPRPVLPKYLTAIYGRIYENLKVSSFLDNPRLLKIFTLGNSSRLIDAALKEIKQSQKGFKSARPLATRLNRQPTASATMENTI